MVGTAEKYVGRYCSVIFKCSAIILAIAPMLLSSSITPLGRPVEPLV